MDSTGTGQPRSIKKAVGLILAASLLPPLLLWLLWRNLGQHWLLSAFITFAVIGYNFLYRLSVGEIVSLAARRHRFDPASRWFRERSGERALYRALKIRKLKRFALTAKPEQFDLHRNTLPQLIQNTCCAELTHEISLLPAFAPLLLIPSCGAAAAFVITSICSAAIDLYFVLIQRFNRPRLLRLQQHLCQRERQRQREHSRRSADNNTV